MERVCQGFVAGSQLYVYVSGNNESVRCIDPVVVDVYPSGESKLNSTLLTYACFASPGKGGEGPLLRLLLPIRWTCRKILFWLP